MSKAITNQVFDYTLVSTDDKAKLIYFEGQLFKSRKRVADELIKHGEILHGVQQLLARCGEFGTWLEAQGLSSKSAYNAINSFVGFGGFVNLQDIEVSAMYVLAKNDGARKKAMRLADKGVKVTHAMAKQLIADCEPSPLEVIESGEDGRTDSDGTEPTEETAPSESRSDTESAGEVEGATNSEWEEVEEEPSLTLDTDMPLPKPLDPAEQAKRAKNLANQYRDKLARAICDYHELAPNRAERDRLVKLVQGVDLW